MPPLISVIIPLYNHEKFISKAISSVLDQTYKNFELIIIDDGSSDNSVAIVSAISDKRIKLYTQENKGAHITINRGISSAKGDYIAILNSDDIFHPTRLQIFINEITTDNSIDALFTQVEAIHEDSSHYFFFPNSPTHLSPIKRDHPNQRCAADLLGPNIVTTTSNLFCKKEVFHDIGLFKNYRYCHDLDFFLRLFHQKHVRFIKEPLLCYRVHATNTLKENSAMVHLEAAIVFTDFLQEYTPQQLFSDLSTIQGINHFFLILQNRHIDKILRVLCQYSQEKNSWLEIKDALLQDETHPFRISCLKHIQYSLANETIQIETNKRLLELSETVKKLKRKSSLLQKQKNHRTMRYCIDKIRKLLHTFKQ